MTCRAQLLASPGRLDERVARVTLYLRRRAQRKIQPVGLVGPSTHGNSSGPAAAAMPSAPERNSGDSRERPALIDRLALALIAVLAVVLVGLGL